MNVDMIIKVGDKETEVYQGVEKTQALKTIAKASPGMAERLRITDERLSLVQKEITADPDMAVEYYLLAAAQSKADELLNCDLNGLSEKEQIKRINQYHRYSSVGSALLYEHTNFGGRTVFFTLAWPNFKWPPYKFNDKASSARAWGINILWEHTWYRGRTLWLVGLPFVEHDFHTVNFNDIASSFAALPP